MTPLQIALDNLVRTGDPRSIEFVLQHPETSALTVQYIIDNIVPTLTTGVRQHEIIMSCVCGNRHTPHDFILNTLRSGHAYYGMALNANLTDEICEELERRGWVVSISCQPLKTALRTIENLTSIHEIESTARGTKHSEVLDHILDHKNPNYVLRRTIASNPNTSVTTLARLLRDSAPSVRTAVHGAITRRGINIIDLMGD